AKDPPGCAGRLDALRVEQHFRARWCPRRPVAASGGTVPLESHQLSPGCARRHARPQESPWPGHHHPRRSPLPPMSPERPFEKPVGPMGTTIALCVGLLFSRCALALNPSLDINQYAHTSWRVGDGLFEGRIQAIAQTPDGYLWVGTELGLLRFDGVRTEPWQPPAGERLPSTNVTKLLVTQDGRLWIGTADGLASWKDGRLVHYPQLAGHGVVALVEDRGGLVWAGGLGVPTGRLCAIQSNGVECFGQDGTLGRGVLSLYEENGNLWVGAETGLWRWKPGPPKRYAMPTTNLNDLSKVDNGPLLIAT